jgi:molybdate-binding protein/transcriptional regulator with XRE-family HTH domain
MSHTGPLPNHVKRLRHAQGWSQHELARRAGVSRTAISALERQRLVPSVAAALALAAALGCRVEELFGAAPERTEPPVWAWPAETDPCRIWEAEVQGRTLLYPAEAGAFCAALHDGIVEHGRIRRHRLYAPEQTLVMASCDPAAAVLAAEYARTTSFRLLVVPRSSREALELLGRKLVHLAGVHLARASAKRGNAKLVQQTLGEGYSLIHVAKWDEGIAIASGGRSRSVKEAAKSPARWVGREAGSGARQCLDELFEGRPAPRRVARDHRGVAEAIRCGWADYGVCVRLVAEEARLQFLSVRHEAYDLVLPSADTADPRLRAFLAVLQSVRYRELLSELPGYDATSLGEVERVQY